MSRIAFSGDQHTEALHLTTLAEQEAALTAMVNETVARGCRALVLCGDTTHGRRPGPDGLGVWGRVFQRASAASLRVIVLAGNHEGDGVTSLLGYFRGSIEAFTEPGLVRDLYGIDLCVLPWLPDRIVRAKAGGTMRREEVAFKLTDAAGEILRGFVAQKRTGFPLVLATHATISGATTSTGFNMGYRAGNDYLIRTEDLEGFDFVAAGHIHKRQQIGGDPSAHPRIVYTGSLLPLDFSETEPKGFVVADFDTGFGKTLGPAVEFVTVPTPTVATWDLDGGPAIRDLVQSYEAGHGSEKPPQKLRVRVTCDEATAREFSPSRIRAALMAAGASMVQVELEVLRPDREQIAVERSPSGALGDYLYSRQDLDTAARLRIDTLATEVLRDEGKAHPAHGDIDLVAIHAEDFLGVHVADVQFDGDGVGVYTLTGPVGSGKSTVGVDAARFALFGESRVGGKMADRLIRTGADQALASVELEDGDGVRYLITRKTKRTGRGPVTTLDVLEHISDADAHLDGTPTAQAGGIGSARWWRPISTGKIADGEAQVAAILGGLDDETMCIANLVVQRRADSFARARPEDRKRLLAQAAGLHVYEDLAVASRDREHDAATLLTAFHAQATPLRTRAAQVPEVEDEIATLTALAARRAGEAENAVADVGATRRAFEAAAERANTYEERRAEVRELLRELEAIDADIAEWKHKRTAADAIIAAKPQLLAAREELRIQRGFIATLEADVVAGHEHNARRAEVIGQRNALERELAQAVDGRKADARDLDRQIDAAARKADLLETATCCAPEPSCVFLTDARSARDLIPALEDKLVEASAPTKHETVLIERLLEFKVPDPADVGPKTDELALLRRSAAVLERNTEVAEKIARAEQVVAESDEATPKLQTRRDETAARKLAKDAALLDFANPQAEADRAQEAWNEATEREKRLRVVERIAREGAAEARGRLAALRDAVAELESVERAIGTGAELVADWSELVRAWRGCRVLVLEGAVIPGVEDAANDILRRFPYGLQIALRTQRDRRSGEGVVETLDVEVLGGRGALYELCSGGERTTIDTALHIAVALVVARRSSTRLRFIVIDEPEGLDEPGRMAFAAVVRSLHEEHGLTVLAMSHMTDIVDALGGRRIVAEPGADGSVVGAV